MEPKACAFISVGEGGWVPLYTCVLPLQSTPFTVQSTWLCRMERAIANSQRMDVTMVYRPFPSPVFFVSRVKRHIDISKKNTLVTQVLNIDWHRYRPICNLSSYGSWYWPMFFKCDSMTLRIQHLRLNLSSDFLGPQTGKIDKWTRAWLTIVIRDRILKIDKRHWVIGIYY